MTFDSIDTDFSSLKTNKIFFTRACLKHQAQILQLIYHLTKQKPEAAEKSTKISNHLNRQVVGLDGEEFLRFCWLIK